MPISPLAPACIMAAFVVAVTAAVVVADKVGLVYVMLVVPFAEPEAPPVPDGRIDEDMDDETMGGQ